MPAVQPKPRLRPTPSYEPGKTAPTSPFSLPALSGGNPASPLSSAFGSMIIEIVARLEPLATILHRYGVSKQQFVQLRATEAFQRAVSEQRKAFSSLANTPDRVRMKAQILTERLLDDMFTVATLPSMPPSARVSAFAQIKNLTGMEKPENAQPAQKFSLTINLTGRPAVHVQSATPGPLIEGEAVSFADQSPAKPAYPLRRVTTPSSPYTADEGALDADPGDDDPVSPRSIPTAFASSDPFEDVDTDGDPTEAVLDEDLVLDDEAEALLPVPPNRPWGKRANDK